MVWFFSKDQARLRVLTSLDAGAGEYVVEIAWPDREIELHRFADKDVCSEYLSTLEDQLEGERWIAEGMRPVDRKTFVN